jgi:hypothetical protein
MQKKRQKDLRNLKTLRLQQLYNFLYNYLRSRSFKRRYANFKKRTIGVKRSFKIANVNSKAKFKSSDNKYKTANVNSKAKFKSSDNKYKTTSTSSNDKTKSASVSSKRLKVALLDIEVAYTDTEMVIANRRRLVQVGGNLTSFTAFLEHL